MRLLLFLVYYGIAFLMGFVLRARFDVWMYSKPHMQARLVVWAQDTVTYVENGGAGPVLPPETTDADAFSPVLGRTPLGQVAGPAQPGEPSDAVPEGLSGRPPETAAQQSDAPPPVRPA